MSVFHYALLPSGFLLLGARRRPARHRSSSLPWTRSTGSIPKRHTAGPAVLGFGPQAPRMSREGAGSRLAAPRRSRARNCPGKWIGSSWPGDAPAGVIVDDKDNIVDFRGDTEPLPRTHARTRNPQPLQDGAQGAPRSRSARRSRKPAKKDAPVRKEGVSLRNRGQIRQLDLEVIPLKGSPEKERPCSCSSKRAPRRGRNGAGPATEPARRHRRGRGERETAAGAGRGRRGSCRPSRRSTRRLTKSCRPRTKKSFPANEELQSINEELETAKEELQSSNEELITLNQELQDRNLQTGRALEYANGIVETVRNPLLILDADLRVEGANGTFYDYFGVTPAETVGRTVSSWVTANGTSPRCGMR